VMKGIGVKITNNGVVKYLKPDDIQVFIQNYGDKYVGQRKNNENNGFGIMIYNNGNFYAGKWLNGKMKKGTIQISLVKLQDM
jgi:hypothetical protein